MAHRLFLAAGATYHAAPRRRSAIEYTARSRSSIPESRPYNPDVCDSSDRLPNRTRVQARSLVAAIVFCLFLLHAPGAAAHARLETSSVAPGAILPAVPATVTLTFTEAIDPGFSSATLLTANETHASTVSLSGVDADDHTAQLVIDAAASLPAGSYALVWRVVSSVDGHATTGLIPFSAGTGAAPEITASASGATNTWPATVGRFFDLASLMALTGALAFALITATHPEPLPEIRQSLRWIARIALPLSALGIAISARALIATSTGHRWLSFSGWNEAWHVLSRTDPGRALAVRLAVTTIMAAAVLIGAGRAWIWRIAGAFLLGVAGLVSVSLTGHAAASDRGDLAIAIDSTHLLAASFWSGGLLLLALSLRPLLSDGRPRGLDVGTRLTHRFSIAALILLALVTISGLVSAYWNVSGQRNLTGETYGLLLITKVTVVLFIIVIAAVNRLLLLPRLRVARAAGETTIAAGQLRRVSISALIEIALAIVVVLLTARLTQIPQANAPLTVEVIARSGHISESQTAGDLSIIVTGPLENTPDGVIDITVRNAATGELAGDLARVIVLASAPNPLGADADPLRDRFDAEPVAGQPGHYRVPRSRLGVEAVWSMSVTARRLGVEDAVAIFDLDLQGTSPQPPRLVDDAWRWPRLPVTGWLSIAAAAATIAGGLALVRRLRGLEPVTAGIMLAVTGLITIGFLLSAYRSGPLPITGAHVAIPGDLGEAAVIQRGDMLWAQQCASCHGTGGGGAGDDMAGMDGHAAGSGNLLTSQARSATSSERYWAITDGIGGTSMPAFDVALTERQRWDLVAYLEWLQSQADE